jgi:radical S-adenosyl methionine domain-containing protein 2
MINRITLSGLAGSGKSTIGKYLGKLLNYEFVSVGNFSRDLAEKQYKLSINEFQDKCKSNPELDIEIDNQFRKMCNEINNIIIDYRLGFKFISDAFHVFLGVSDEIAAERIKLAKRTNEQIDIIDIKNRNLKMRDRFLNLYNVDFTDVSNFDLVINTDNLTPNQIANKIITAMRDKNEQQ